MPRRNKTEMRARRHRSLRKRMTGTPERPRLVVFRSARHTYAQVVDDLAHRTLAAASDLASRKDESASALAKKRHRAKTVGAQVAKLCLEKGIRKVVFDRAGYRYHGRVSAVAAGAREAGLDF